MSRKRRGLLGRKRAARPAAATEPTAPSEEPQRTRVPHGTIVPPLDVPAEPPATLAPPPAQAPEDSTPEAPAPEVRSTAEPQRTAPENAPFPRAGDALGQWVLGPSLGTIQGCELFPAQHKNTQRIRVVLKVLRPDAHTSPDLVREGELLFALKHANIASVRNLKLTHDPPFLEMDELPGDRLDVVLERTQVFMAQALDLVEQLLGALVYLHARNVFHRDIQPRHIVLRPNGVLTLMGFAFAVEGTPDIPPPQTALGYMPPEWPAIQDPVQADLYATGCLLYELLTGRSPLQVPAEGSPLTTAVVLRRKRTLPYLDPGERFHEDLRNVVRSLTSLDPNGRFQTAATALGRLQRVDRTYNT